MQPNNILSQCFALCKKRPSSCKFAYNPIYAPSRYIDIDISSINSILPSFKSSCLSRGVPWPQNIKWCCPTCGLELWCVSIVTRMIYKLRGNCHGFCQFIIPTAAPRSDLETTVAKDQLALPVPPMSCGVFSATAHRGATAEAPAWFQLKCAGLHASKSNPAVFCCAFIL